MQNSASSREKRAAGYTSAESVMFGTSNGHEADRNFGEHSARENSSGTTKKSLPANGKKTKGRVKIKMEFIDNKLRRYTTFSKRKTGIMKKAYELSTLTGTQVMLLVASETGHVYTFATRKLQPMITSEAGKALIQTCLNSPDPPAGPGASALDQRMSATGFEETDLTYSVGDDCEKMSSDDGRQDSPPMCDLSPSPNSGSTLLTSGTLSSATFQTSIDSSVNASNSRSVFRIPSQSNVPQTFALSTSGQAKHSLSTSSSPTPSHGSISVVQGTSPNLSLVSGNVVIPATQTLLPNNSGNSLPGTFMYQTPQGLVYATPTTLGEGMILNLGHEQGGTQQFITIPVSLSLTPAHQQQLMQVSTTMTSAGDEVRSSSPIVFSSSSSNMCNKTSK